MAQAHVHHPSLAAYNAEAALQDGCPVCEARANDIAGLCHLDETRFDRLWNVMLDTEYGGGDQRLVVTQAERKAAHLLYLMAVLLERMTPIDPWQPLGQWRLERTTLRAVSDQ